MSSTRFNPPVPTFAEVDGSRAETPDSDGHIYPGENDYQGSTNKRTLGSYISSLTRGEVPTENVVEYNGPIPTHGNAYPIGDASGNPSATYTENGVEGGSVNALDNYSNSLLFNVPSTGKDLSSIINKGQLGEGQGRETLSGHLLLQGVVGSSAADGTFTPRTEGAKAYVEAIPGILADKNYYDPSRKAAPDAGETYPAADRQKVQDNGQNISTSATVGTVKVEELSKVAIDIMLKASGKSSDGSDALKGFVPSGVQYGAARVDSEELRAGSSTRVAGLSSTIGGNGPVNLPTTDGIGEDRYTHKSYGVTYNPLEAFGDLTSGVTSFSLLAASATASVLVVLGIFSIPGLGGGNEDFPTFKNFSAASNKERALEKGEFRFAKEEPGGLLGLLAAAGVETDLAKVLNFYAPSNGLADYGSCVIIGFASFVGAEFSDDALIKDNLFDTGYDLNIFGVLRLLGAIALRFLAIALTSDKGNYLNLFREIVKDSSNLITNISDLGLANAVPSLTQSKIVRFVDTLAKIGDLVMLQAKARRDYRFNQENTEGSPYVGSFKVSDANGKLNDASLRFAMQRIRGSQFGKTRGSSLGVDDIPSAHLIPENYRSILSDARFNYTPVSGSSGRTNLRLKQEEVRDLERVLDAEYMPFYFQDLRTNEIVSFHAFLDDLSDSYTANYNSVSGYGRVEDIKMYKDTKRSVGCTFHVVATNQKDFEYMWWQINKLTTLVYPQWSQGRKITTQVLGADFKFTQPFSQVPNATPVIRVRVGDLIRSNYSRFNLKRLFGYKETGTKQVTSTGYYAPPGDYKDDDDDELQTVEIKHEIVFGSTAPEPSNDIERGSNYVVKMVDGTNLRIPISSIRSVSSDSPAAAEESFYKPENNSIIKSFESTMGMGLAAVVTQLQFTWMDSLWGAGDDGPGNRAPRSCKVQMSFEPIHDIVPGIDHEGFNRAPIYPVGDLVNKIVEGGEKSPYGEKTVTRQEENNQLAAVNTSV